MKKKKNFNKATGKQRKIYNYIIDGYSSPNTVCFDDNLYKPFTQTKYNIGDVVKLGLKWGLTGANGWIPEDLNNDGVINIGDVVVVGLYWGQTW